MYSLDHSDKAKELVTTDREIDNYRLGKRKESLAKQLERGLQIVASPVQFLKSQQCK